MTRVNQPYEFLKEVSCIKKNESSFTSQSYFELSAPLNGLQIDPCQHHGRCYGMENFDRSYTTELAEKRQQEYLQTKSTQQLYIFFLEFHTFGVNPPHSLHMAKILERAYLIQLPN